MHGKKEISAFELWRMNWSDKLQVWQISRQIISANISLIYDNRLCVRKRPVE